MNARRIILAVLVPAAAVLAAGLLLVSRADAAGTFVQSTWFKTSAARCDVGPLNIAAGNWMLVAAVYKTTDTPLISDSALNTWIPLSTTVTITGSRYLKVWYAENIQPYTGNTVTITTATNVGTFECGVLEYSGIATSGSLDVQATNATGSGTAPTSNSLTNTGGDLLVAIGGGDVLSTWSSSSGSPYTFRGIHDRVAVQDLNAGPGAQSSAFSVNNSQAWGVVFAAFHSPTTYYSRASGSWGSNTTWSTASCGGTAVASGMYPAAGDIVTVCSGHTVTLAAAAAAATVTIASTGTLQLVSYNMTVSGATSVSGTLGINSNLGAKTFTGDVTINSGGTWTNSGNGAVSFGGNLSNSGTFTAGTGTQTF